MENLEILNLVELNAQETATTEGGAWYHWVVGACFATTAVALAPVVTVAGAFGVGFYNGMNN